jgi:serine acetyltransferase
VHYRLTNRGDATVMGLLTVRVDDAHVVAARSLTLPPRTAAVVAVEIPARLVAAHPDRRVKVDARFTPYGDV